MLIQDLSYPPVSFLRRESAVPPVRIRLIGHMEVLTAAGTNILPVGRKTRGLLAILALAAPRPVVRSRLAQLLWSRRLDEQARASLRQEVHRLGETLHAAGHEIVRVARDHLSLRTDLAVVDVHEILRATDADPAVLSLLDERLLDEFDGIDPALDQWLTTERERLRDRARSVAEMLMQRSPEPEAVIPVATRLLAVDRAHEGAWRALMEAHARRGERGLATQAYERCRAALANGMGATPSAETQRLAADIRAGLLARPTLSSPTLPNHDRSRGRTAARVGILPLKVIGSAESESGLALGLGEAITAALARFRWMVLVSSSSLAKAGLVDDVALGEAFGLDFVLDGSVQRVEQRSRVTLRLIDLREGNQVIWTRRFDRDAADLLNLQDDIAAEVAAQIDPEILQAESRRAARRSAADSTPYDLVLRAQPMITRMGRDEFTQAGTLLERALKLAPDYAAAHAWRAYWAMCCLGQGWANETSMAEEAGRHAESAIMLDPQDARGLSIAGHVRAFLHKRRREALELHSQALSFNPNLGMAWGLSAMTFTYLGDWDEAGRRFARYKRLVPLDPGAYLFEAGVTRLELGRGDYAAAVVAGRRTTELSPHYTPGLKHYLAALGHAGMAAEAAAVRARLLAIEPGYTVRTAIGSNPYEHAADMDRYAAGLRLAGLPDHDGPDQAVPGNV